MDTLSAVQTISLSDVISMTKDIASLNATYLGITVTIILAVLTILVGVFYFINFRPLKESIDKQEKTINDRINENEIKNLELLKTLQEEVQTYKDQILKTVTKTIEDAHDAVLLEVKTTIAESETELIEKLTAMADAKDATQKALITSEVSEKLSKLEANLKTYTDNAQVKLNSSLEQLGSKVSTVTERFNNQKIEIIELQRFMYSQQGKMGSIYKSIVLLDEAITQKSWRIPTRITELQTEIEGYVIDADVATKIEKQLIRLDGDKQYTLFIEKLRGVLEVSLEQPKSTPSSPSTGPK